MPQRNTCLRNDHKFLKKCLKKPAIKMNTKTVNEFRSIAKDKGLCGYYKLKKADLIALLLEQSTEEIPRPPPRNKVKKRKACTSRKDNPKPSRN